MIDIPNDNNKSPYW